MNKKDGFNYYDAYAAQVGYAYEMACNLRSALDAGELGTRELMDALHTVESDADEVNHEIQSHLTTDFVVPLERSSMSELANALDDVSDEIEDIAIQAYYYRQTDLAPGGTSMAEMLVGATEQLKCAVELLPTAARGGRAKHLHEHLVRAQSLESDCDRVYVDSVYEVYGREDLDAEGRRIAHALLSALEEALDAVEEAAECVQTVMANEA